MHCQARIYSVSYCVLTGRAQYGVCVSICIQSARTPLHLPQTKTRVNSVIFAEHHNDS